MKPQEIIARKKVKMRQEVVFSGGTGRKNFKYREIIKFIILRTIGNFLVLFAIWGMVMTFGPAIYLDVLYRINSLRNVTYIVKNTDTKVPINSRNIIPTPQIAVTGTLFGQLAGGNKVEVLDPISTQFGIVIPKIGANAPIFPNVDAGKPEVYLPYLQKGVAHAAGTVFPGVKGNTYLFAHSTDSFWNIGRYNAIFYLLKELNNGDEIDIFLNGVRYVYRVVNKLVVNPSDVRFLTEATPYEQLTLQTCWPPGTTFKRLVILARPESELVR